jgi:transcription elongation factor S-II
MDEPPAQLQRFKKRLDKAAVAGDEVDMYALLQALDNVVPTIRAMKESRIGLSVGRLRNHSSPRVSALATQVVLKWKALLRKSKSESGTGALSAMPRSPVVGKQQLAKKQPVKRVKSSPTPATPQPADKATHAVPEIPTTGNNQRDHVAASLCAGLAMSPTAEDERIVRIASAIEEGRQRGSGGEGWGKENKRKTKVEEEEEEYYERLLQVTCVHVCGGVCGVVWCGCVIFLSICVCDVYICVYIYIYIYI